MGVDGLALHNMGVKHRKVFTCEANKHCNRFLDDNFPDVEARFGCAHSSEFKQHAPPCDLLSAGFPCQPFSTQGLGLGIVDPRGSVIFEIITYVKKNLNLASLCSKMCGGW